MLVFKATVEYKLLSIGVGYETAKLLLEQNYGIIIEVTIKKENQGLAII